MQLKKTGLLLGLILVSTGLAMADWQSFPLTDNSYAESMPSIDLDPSDNPHFAWCSNNDGDYDIYYLSEATGTPAKVTNNNINDLYPCLRIDQAGNAHIAFKGYDGHDYEEFYVNNIGGSFCDPIQVSFTETDVGVFVPEHSCLSIDPAGVAHIAYKYGYYEYGNWDIYYANNEGGAFGSSTRVTDETGGKSYVRPSIALDNDNYVHTVFENGTDILYTNNVAGTFDSLTTVSEGLYRWHGSVGIDSSNKIHIAYAGYHGGAYYINNVSGSFDSTFVLSNDNSMNGPASIALDHLDNIHIAFIGGDFGSPDSQELYYVNNCTGSFEDPEQITYNSEHTTDISLSVDSLCACYIAFLEGFYGSNDYEVWYCTNSGFVGISSDNASCAGNNPSSFSLQNHPNPFNPTTTISYQLPVNADVTLSIYNILGQKLLTLVNENKPSGYHSVLWNGTDENNQPVPSGVYFYQLTAGSDLSETERMMILR
ncbi:MAG: T9SS type A sorting domain-containing protein [Candidatus Aegiribacteria sp.]|nr:T9SS type A sorting domain-containing protein [Candidatus Aegiribacteria sp.]